MPLWGCAAASNAANRDKTTREWNEALARIERMAQGRLGVAMLDTGSGLALGWRQDERFAMASTFKAVLAGWMLALVDQGKERLDARVHYAAADVVAYSPVSGPRAGNGGGLTVGELCAATVSLSDNTAANVLMARHGGPAGFTAFVRSLGDSITRLDRTEPTLNEAAVGDPRDTTTPQAMLQTLQKLVLGDVLTPSSRAWLQRWLVETSTGDKRLRAGVPGWKVGDKTGTAGDSGTANDIGVMWPPRRRRAGADDLLPHALYGASRPAGRRHCAGGARHGGRAGGVQKGWMNPAWPSGASGRYGFAHPFPVRAS